MHPTYHYHKNGTEPPFDPYNTDINPWILVFGSNQAGVHGAGAAKLAHDKYGARYGVGFGLEQRSFAIPTKDLQIQTLKLPAIENFVSLARRHIKHRIENAHNRFWFTAIGCGLAGYTHMDIAPMFAGIGEGIRLPAGTKLADFLSFPEEWKEFLDHEHYLEEQLFNEQLKIET
jgi:hypothetical protein